MKNIIYKNDIIWHRKKLQQSQFKQLLCLSNIVTFAAPYKTQENMHWTEMVHNYMKDFTNINKT